MRFPCRYVVVRSALQTPRTDGSCDTQHARERAVWLSCARSRVRTQWFDVQGRSDAYAMVAAAWLLHQRTAVTERDRTREIITAIGSGEAALFTGAGFSAEATDRAGRG